MAPGALCAIRQRAAAALRHMPLSMRQTTALRQRALFLLALCALAACTTAERPAPLFGAPVLGAGAYVPSGTQLEHEHNDVGSVEDQSAPRRRLSAVAAPQPTSGWCGAPPSNTFGTTLGAPGSCLGDVAIAAAVTPPQCTATDVNFTIPDLHFHQVRCRPRRVFLLLRPQFTATCGPYAGWNLLRSRQLRQGVCRDAGGNRLGLEIRPRRVFSP